jgi:hypothetical protein
MAFVCDARYSPTVTHRYVMFHLRVACIRFNRMCRNRIPYALLNAATHRSLLKEPPASPAYVTGWVADDLLKCRLIFGFMIAIANELNSNQSFGSTPTHASALDGNLIFDFTALLAKAIRQKPNRFHSSIRRQ